VGTVPDRLLGVKSMTVREHLALRARVFPWWDSAYLDRLVEELDIPLHITLPALSKGTQAKVAFVSVEAFRPPVLLLDEPTSGLDPVVRMELRQVMHRALKERPGRCILFSTHLLEDLEDLVDRLLVMQSGKLIADRPVSRTASREDRRVVLDGAMELLARRGKEVLHEPG
jgi:ABC-2 type transport system ATP-binding protein